MPAIARKRAILAAASALCLIFGGVPAASAQSAVKSHRKPIVKIQPDYPAVLKNGHFEGQVRIDATVLADGSVTKVEIKGGNPMLSQYAAEAVRKWKYAPGPTQTVEEVIFNFDAYR
jgi:TonB family protein